MVLKKRLFTGSKLFLKSDDVTEAEAEAEEKEIIKEGSLYQVLINHFTDTPEHRLNSVGMGKIIQQYFIETYGAAKRWLDDLKKKYGLRFGLGTLQEKPVNVLNAARVVLDVLADDPMEDGGITMPQEDELLEFILDKIHKDPTSVNYSALADIASSKIYSEFQIVKDIYLNKRTYSLKRDEKKARLSLDLYSESMLAGINNMSPDYVCLNQDGMRRITNVIHPIGYHNNYCSLLEHGLRVQKINGIIDEKIKTCHERENNTDTTFEKVS